MTSRGAERPPPAGSMQSGSPISIAVIDSGVNPGHPHVGPVAGGVALTADGGAHDDFVDRLGHGTAVTAAIQEKAPGAEVFVVKVFDDALATSVPTLVRALDWASERGIRLVNLSLGTPNAHRADQLEPAVRRAVERGTLIVSAFEHEGVRWLPGSMPGVVGVVLDTDCPREIVHVGFVDAGAGPGEPVIDSSVGPGRRVGGPTAGPARHVLVASPYPRPIPGVPVERNLHGISFAVANATGALAARMQHASAGPDASGLDASSAVALFDDA